MDAELAAILNAPPDPERPYVYRGTRCHINKFGILNPSALEKVVRCVTGLRSEMLRGNPIAGSFDLDHLRAIHRFLFLDVYEWAGELRIVDFHRDDVKIYNAAGQLEVVERLTNQGPSFYIKAADIVAESERVFGALAREGYLRGLDRQSFIERGTHYLRQVFDIHPFRDGNGRVTRMFISQLAAAAGWRLDLEWVPQIRRHVAAWRAHSGDITALREVFEQSLHGDCEPTGAYENGSKR